MTTARKNLIYPAGTSGHPQAELQDTHKSSTFNSGITTTQQPEPS